eukprot:scaffold168351_cov23-Attheya_sp.AAC.1
MIRIVIGWMLPPFPIFSWFRQRYSPDPSPEEPRWVRRSHDAFAHKNIPRYRSPSSRDYGLCRQYPFRLRKENQFVTQLPTLHEQNVTQLLSKILSSVNAICHIVTRLKTPGREGDNHQASAHNNPRCHKSPFHPAPPQNQQRVTRSTPSNQDPHLYQKLPKSAVIIKYRTGVKMKLQGIFMAIA